MLFPAANLQVNPIETFSANNKVKVYTYFHGLYDDTFNRDNVTLAGITGDKQSSAVNIDKFLTDWW